MAMEIMGNYNNYAVQSMAENTREKETVNRKGASQAWETAEPSKTESKSEYLSKLQKQAPYLTLEIGSGLSMAKDKRGGVLTINPLLLERMQNDPEAEKKYTQTIKDIERAEKTADAYYNSLGGCVERTSHWYIDENGKYCHFAYTVRDDRLNKKLRKEAQENSKKLIEKTREKSVEKKEKLQKALEKKKEAKKAEQKSEKQVPDKVKQLFDEKEAASKNGIVSLLAKDVQVILEAVREEEAGKADAKKQEEAVGRNLDLQV